MNLFIVRHGESYQNIGKNYPDKKPDHIVELTENGIKQAKDAGEFLSKYFKEKSLNKDKTRIWVSPYLRTRHTAELINEHLGIKEVFEDITLIEQRYGLFSSNPIEECKRRFPDQWEYYDLAYQNGGKFFAKLPQGESPFDVVLRIKQFYATLGRDNLEYDSNLIIVTHGTTLRALIMALFHLPPEWYDEQGVPTNCAIRHIYRDKNNKSHDKGYIFGSEKKRKAKKADIKQELK